MILPQTAAGLPEFEQLINGLLENQAGTLPHYLNENLYKGLRANLEKLLAAGKMHPAGIGRQADFQQNAKVRGDVISWIDNDSNDPFEKAFLEQVAAFVNHLNATCYTGIRNWEFHYALYAPGSFYKRHRDQFQSNSGRKFSMVHYLNDNWQNTDGGQLLMYTPAGTTTILPEGGSVVFFQSDQTEHEVLPAARPRMSIAGWLKD